VNGHRTTATTRRWLIGLALSALMAAQWLALLHSALGHGMARAADAAAVARVAPDADESLRGLAAAHDDGSVVCQLLDQCLQASHAASAPIAPADAVPDRFVPAAHVAALPGAPRTGYLARAPPQRVPTHQG
jgi:hypothetical protein